MRLSVEQIKQGVLHPSREVRDACISYFAYSYSDDREIMPLAIQAMDQYGLEDAFGAHFFFARLTQTEESLDWTIEQLRHRGRPDDDDEPDLTFWLLDALTGADPALLKAHEDEIRDLEVADEKVIGAIEERILLHGFAADKLWKELEEFCERNKTEDYLLDDEIDFAHRVIEAMSRHKGVYDARVLEMLAQDIEDYDDNPMVWMEPFLVRLAGELGLEQALPLVVAGLHEDDPLNHECIRCLKMIGEDSVVDALAREFRETEWNFRVGAAEVLGAVHTDRAVERCLAFLEREEDQEVKCRLALSAVANFADAAIEPARQLILCHELDPYVIEVRNALVASSMLMGIDVPEREQWREDAEGDEEFRIEWYTRQYMIEGDHDEEFLDDDYDDDGYDDYRYADYDAEPVPLPYTIVNEEPKIGRNDPCPCGSGKKYKKCCMKKLSQADEN